MPRNREQVVFAQLFSRITNFGCEKSRQYEKRLQPSRNAHLVNEEETNVFNSRFNKSDGTSLHQVGLYWKTGSAYRPAGPSGVSMSATSETGRSMRHLYATS